MTPKRVGFWAPSFVSTFGLLSSVVSGGVTLPRASDHVDAAWDRVERQRVLDYVEDQSRRSMGYMGWSECRICGCRNGTFDFTDGTYIWPEGFGHYLREHDVRPPQDFIDHVLRESS